MQTVITIIAVLTGLLSIAAGGAKMALVPEEVEFLSQFGFTNVVTMVFGVLQVLGGLGLIIPITRFYGALVTVLGFAVSAVLVLLAGNAAFAGVSLVPVVLAAFIAYQSYSARPAVAP